jgi:hypothetical protein
MTTTGDKDKGTFERQNLGSKTPLPTPPDPIAIGQTATLIFALSSAMSGSRK